MSKSKGIAEAQASENTGIAPLSNEMAERASKVDDGANLELRPRLRINRGLEMVVGTSTSKFKDGLDFIVLGVKGITRELHDVRYDPKNTKPPSCFSLDGEVPHELANPPMVIDRSSGESRPATGCQTDCPGSRNGFKCSYKRQIVGVVPDKVTKGAIVSFPLPAVSIFHKGDVEDNDFPDDATGLIPYIERVKSIATDGDSSIKLFQLVTHIKAHSVVPQGEAASFNFRDADGNIKATPPEIVNKCIDIMETPEYQKALNSYEQYLITGAKITDKEEAEETSAEPDMPQSDNVDDLKS